MKINEQVTIDLNLLRPSDTIPIWSASDTSLIDMIVAPDGQSALVTALKEGHIEIGVISNCDFGSGVRQHNTTFIIDVDGSDSAPSPVVVTPVAAAVVETDSQEEPDSPYWKNPDGN